MPGKKVRLRVITPEKIKVDEETDMVIVRCTTGDWGILPGHESHWAALGIGVLRMLNGGEERKLAVFGGIAEVQNDVVTILTSNAELPEDIDRTRAEADHEIAVQRLQKSVNDFEIQSDQVSLRRSLVRIEVSSYPLISKQEEE